MGTRPDGTPDRRHVERKTEATRNRASASWSASGTRAWPGSRAGCRPSGDADSPPRRGAPAARPGTADDRSDYWSQCRHDIFPRWGGQRIDRMLPEYLEDGYAEMLADGHAPSHVRKVHAILSSAYEDRGEARQRRPQSLPPGRAARARRSPRWPRSPSDQARAILAAVAGRRNAARWSVGLACGLRQGEALGLRWQFVDLERGELRVWYQLQRLTWRHGCDKPGGHLPRSCPKRRGGGLVFREIKERRRKTVKLPRRAGHRPEGAPGGRRPPSGWPRRTSGRTTISSSASRTGGRSTRAPTGRSGRTS